MPGLTCTELLPNLFRFEDGCNVYVLRDGQAGLAIDFGAGGWLRQLPKLGIQTLEGVLLTHHHDDQVAGLAERADWPFTIHAPVGEERYLDPARTNEYHGPPWYEIGCPESYLPPRRRVPGVTYDLAGFGNLLWRGRKISIIHTPGHGPNACSFVLEHAGRQVVFCGDAAHAGATVWQPFHLEWDHWTGTGALAAWEGVMRLAGLATDLLCPSHGPVVDQRPRDMLRTLARRLMRFYEAKGQISPGEPDHFPVPLQIMDCGALQYLPHLYQFGANGYLLVSRHGTGLVVDPHLPDLPTLEALLAELGDVRPTALVVSHYHYDHCDGIPALRERHGAQAWLHPWIADILQQPERALRPWMHDYPITADRLWPEAGDWSWEEYRFRVAPWPGQTWWHCAFMADVDGQRVLFGGDSFVPTSRWNGTGGFCAYNHSRFSDGFVPSAQLARGWRPDIVAAGHGNYYAFRAGKFRKIIAWARRAEAAVRDLCPSGDLEQDYYCVRGVMRAQTTPRLPKYRVRSAMTPREKLIMALRGEKPPGLPPHLELVYQLFDEWPGVPWLQGVHLEGTSGAWRQEVLRGYCEAILQCAEEFDWCCITSLNSLPLEDQCRCMGYLREMSGETYMLSVFLDGTYAIPNGQGMYDFAVRIAEEPEAVLEEAQRRVDSTLEQVRMAADAGAEIVFMCSDYCFNDGPFLSPTMFSQFVTPFLQKQVEGIHELGLYAVKHTDGQIMPVLDQLAGTGIDALHSLDPMAGVDIAEVKRLVGDQLCLMGNVDCSQVQAGTREGIRESALYCLEHGGAASGGYVYCTSNCIFRGVPLENYRYMLQLRQEFGAV